MDRRSLYQSKPVGYLILVLSQLWWSTLVCAQEVALLPSSSSSAYQQFIQEIQQQPASPALNFRVLRPEADLSLLDSPDTDLLVTIGTRALSRALKSHVQTKILAVLITRGAFEELIATHDASRHQLKQGRISALYLEQPTYRYLCLATALLPEAKRVGSVTGALSSALIEELIPLGNQLGIELIHHMIDIKENPTRPIEKIMRNSDIYLALPDNALFNRGTAKWVLLTGLKWRVPIIGFSARYAEAGAVAAIHTTPVDAASETSRLILQHLSDQAEGLNQPQYPNQYTLTINHKVARKLGLSVLDEQTIRNHPCFQEAQR